MSLASSRPATAVSARAPFFTEQDDASHPLGVSGWAKPSHALDTVDSARSESVRSAMQGLAEDGGHALASATTPAALRESIGRVHGHRPPQYDLFGRQLPAGKTGVGSKKRSGVMGKLDRGALADRAPLASTLRSLSQTVGWKTKAAPGAGAVRKPAALESTLRGAAQTGPGGAWESKDARFVAADEPPDVPRYYNAQGRPLMPEHWRHRPRHATRTALLQERRRAEMPDLSYDIDGDGVVSSLDYFVARTMDVDKDGRLTAAERREAWQRLQDGFADGFYVARGGATSMDTRVQHDKEGNVLASDVEGGVVRAGGAAAGPGGRAVVLPPYATAGPGGALAAAEDEPEYAARRSLAASLGERSRRRLRQSRRLRDAVALDDTFGDGVQIRGAVRAARTRAEAAAAEAEKANEAAALAAARRAVRMTASVGDAAGAGSLGPRDVERIAARAVADAATGADGGGDAGSGAAARAAAAARTAARSIRRPAAAAAVSKTERQLLAVDAAVAGEGAAADDPALAVELLRTRGRQEWGATATGGAAGGDADSLGSVEDRAKPFEDASRTRRANHTSRRRLLRERRKETTRAALAATRVSDAEFGLDERESPRSEDGEFWEHGGRPMRSGGVAEASKTLGQMKRRRRAVLTAEAARFQPPASLGVHKAPLPSYAETLRGEGAGWFEQGDCTTVVRRPWQGSELDGHALPGAGAGAKAAGVTGGGGRRLDATTRRPLVADGLRREGDDAATVRSDPFKTRSIRHGDRPEVIKRRGRDIPEDPSKVDHWREWRETQRSGTAPGGATTKRFTVKRFTTAAIEHQQAEERAGADPNLDDTGKERLVNPAETKPLYSSFAPDGRFREPTVPRVEDVMARTPASPLQRRRAERSVREEAKAGGGGGRVATASRGAARRRKERTLRRRRGSLAGTGVLLAADDPDDALHRAGAPDAGPARGFAGGVSPSAWAGVSAATDVGAPPSTLRASTASLRSHQPPARLHRHRPAAAAASAVELPRHGGARPSTAAGSAFERIGDAARQHAEATAPRLRRQRLWADHHQRASSSQRSRGLRHGRPGAASAPSLPAVRPRGTVASSGLSLVTDDE